RHSYERVRRVVPLPSHPDHRLGCRPAQLDHPSVRRARIVLSLTSAECVPEVCLSVDGFCEFRSNKFGRFREVLLAAGTAVSGAGRGDCVYHANAPLGGVRPTVSAPPVRLTCPSHLSVSPCLPHRVRSAVSGGLPRRSEALSAYTGGGGFERSLPGALVGSRGEMSK